MANIRSVHVYKSGCLRLTVFNPFLVHESSPLNSDRLRHHYLFEGMNAHDLREVARVCNAAAARMTPSVNPEEAA